MQLKKIYSFFKIKIVSSKNVTAAVWKMWENNQMAFSYSTTCTIKLLQIQNEIPKFKSKTKLTNLTIHGQSFLYSI